MNCCSLKGSCADTVKHTISRRKVSNLKTFLDLDSKRNIRQCILYSNKKAGIVSFHRKCFQVGRTALNFAAASHIETVIVPRANNLTKIINMAFAQRLSIVRTTILDCGKIVIVTNEANSGIADDNQLRLVGKNSLECFCFCLKDPDPIHIVVQLNAKFLSSLPSSNCSFPNV